MNKIGHERAVVNSWCKSLGKPLLIHPEGGVHIPPDMHKIFNGKTFWPIFEKSGHTTIDFNDCCCSH